MATAFKSEYRNLTPSYIDAMKGLHAGFYTISANSARELLKRNVINRKMKEINRAQLRDDLVNGRFMLNGESIIFSSDGKLLNGQHRLEECAATGVPITSLVAMGIAPEAIYTMDQGRARTTGDILSMDGAKNANVLASIARWFESYSRGDGRTLGRGTAITRAAQLDVIQRHPELAEIANWATHFSADLRGLASASILGLARAILEPRFGDEAVFYLERVAKGDELSAEDPAFAVRRRLHNHPTRASFAFALECILRGAVAHMEGRKLTRIQIENQLPKELWKDA